MAEFFEVRTTIEGHERAAALAHGILLTGLATSIDIAEVPNPAPGHDDTAWQLTLITTERQVSHVERHIRETAGDRPIDRDPVIHDIDRYPDWLADDQS
ncbi:hypothetical protein [Nonomuraea candida]|uniref:hypothetical protein n=1 Tax=Nonomuraea candida TaxID=359159 RepID=UPI0005B91B1F|nr:hypothetical protein [Nonomuraea candida]